MPYKVAKDGDQWCVHKENADGSVGAKVQGGCHPTEAEAKRHMRALYANVPDAKAAALTISAPPDDIFAGMSNELRAAMPDRAEVEYFEDGILCKVERNANGDYISMDNARDLSRTIAWMPIVDDHPRSVDDNRMVGVYISGDVREVHDGQLDGTYVFVNGLLYPNRFPQQTADIKAGRRKMSVEAVSDRVRCSACEREFSVVADYCDHLKPIVQGKRLANGVTRHHYGMKAVGGAAVRIPAGTNAGFDRANFLVIASEYPEEENNMDELKNEVAEVKRLVASMQERDGEAATRITTLEADLKAAQDALEAAQADLDAKIETAVKAAVEAEKERSGKVIARAFEMFTAGVDRETVENMMEGLDTVDEKAFNLIVTQAGALKENTGSPVQASMGNPPHVDDDGNKGVAGNPFDVLK